MNVLIEGKNIELTSALKDYVNDKFSRLRKHYEHLIKEHDIRVKLSVAKNPRISTNNITEVTIFMDGKIIRSEQASEDMYASIDLVTDKLERQLHKYKDRVYRSQQHKGRPLPNPELMNDLLEEGNNQNHRHDVEGKIIKSKKFKLHPLTPEEASEHLDLISHDFYVFINSKTKQINTIYLRKDGDYGLIEPAL